LSKGKKRPFPLFEKEGLGEILEEIETPGGGSIGAKGKIWAASSISDRNKT
jgi:hypothetical protein